MNCFFTLYCLYSSSPDVTIRTILNESCDGALIAVIATSFLQVLIASRNLLKTSLDNFFLVSFDDFFTTINSDGTFQLKTTVGLRLVRNFYKVAVFK